MAGDIQIAEVSALSRRLAAREVARGLLSIDIKKGAPYMVDPSNRSNRSNRLEPSEGTWTLRDLLSRRGPEPADARPLAESIPAMTRAALTEGPLKVAARVRAAIIAACPEFENDPYFTRVIDSIISGDVPEAKLAEALERFRRRLQFPEDSPSGPIKNVKAYLAVVLRDLLGQHHVAWEPLRQSGAQAG